MPGNHDAQSPSISIIKLLSPAQITIYPPTLDNLVYSKDKDALG